MADDILLKLSVDDRDLIRTRKEQQKFQYQLALVEKEFRKGNITSARYNAELAKQARELTKLGGSYNKANSEVRKYAYSLRQASDAQVDLAMAMTASGKGMRRMEVLAQQAGYQIGDLAVQIQSGTNAAVALGQQGSQLLGFFGPTGAIAGAGLAIATGLIAPLLKAKDEVKELDDAIKSVTASLKEWTAQKKAASLGITLDELIGVESVAAAEAKVKAAKQLVDSLNKTVTSPGFGAAGGIDLLALFGLGEEANLEDAKAKLEEAEQQLADIQAKVRQEAREKAEDTLNAAFAQDQRNAALSEWKTGQEVIKKRKEWVATAIQIFQDAQRRMFLQDQAAIQGTIDAMSQTRALEIKLRFAGEETAMGRSAFDKPSKLRPTQSYEDLIAMGWSPEDLERIGIKPSRSGSKRTPKKSNLEKFQEQLAIQKDIINMTEAEATVRKALGDEYKNVGKGVREELAMQVEAINEEQRKAEETKALVSSISSSFEDGFMSIVDGTKSVKEAFRSMASEILKELYRVLVVKKMVNQVVTALGFANGGVFQGGSQVTAFAKGGIVGGPTFFPMSGGKTGLMGEAGPEAIMPLKRGKDGKLGVASEGSGQVVVNQSFNFTANGDESVKKIIAQAAPQIAQMTQKQIMDSRRRGGQMKATFG